jgi:4-hydroxybenzoate polyprenyltransferase
MPRLRSLLVLGRVSNLPTVWSNCLAGWWLGGHASTRDLPFLLIGVTLLYVGGMYLNDAFDANFDRQHRKERPIPRGDISTAMVSQLALLWIVLGLASLFWIGDTTGLLGVALVFCIVLYDAVHKLITFSPLLMGACRFFVYPLAASLGAGVNGWSVWCGLALGSYVVGLSFLARRESARGPVQRWPLIFLPAPIALAFLMNVGEYRKSATLISIILALWMLVCLRTYLSALDRRIGRTVAGLLAGIVFVDWLAVADAPRNFGLVFLALFGLAVLFQRFVPAT